MKYRFYILLYLLSLLGIINTGFKQIYAQDIVTFEKGKSFVDSVLLEFEDEILLNNDTILSTIYQIYTLSQKIGYDKGYCESCYFLGRYYDIRSLGDTSIKYYLKAWEYGQKIDYEFYFKPLGYEIAGNYWQIGNLYEGLNYGLKAKEFYESINYNKNLHRINNVLGLLYRDLGDYDIALESFLKAHEYAIQIDDSGYAGIVYSNIGALYLRQHQLDKALEYYHIGVKTEEKYGYIAYAGRSYVALARIYLEKNEPEKVRYYLDKALSNSLFSEDVIGFTRAYRWYGELYLYQQNYKTAIEYLKKAEIFAVKQGRNITLAEIYNKLSLAYDSLRLKDSAYYYFKAYYEINQEIFDVSKLNEIKRTEYQLQVEQNKSKLSQLEFEKQKQKLKLLIIIIVLAIALSVLFIALYVQTNRTKEHLKKINKELKLAKDKAEESDRLKSAFLANISHEIRTPMNAIIGFSDLLVDINTSTDEREQLVTQLNNNCNTLLHLIGDIIDLAKIEANELTLFVKNTDINSILKELLENYNEAKKKFNKKYISINLDKGSLDKKFYLKTDSYRFRQVMNNLMDNALKYTITGTINFGYKIFDNLNRIEFYIKDTGIGIPSENHKKIFQRFNKIETDKTNIYRGTGLGLTITQKIVERLGGVIRLESEVNKGSTFYFTLPLDLAQDDEIKNSKVDVIKDYKKWEDKTILIAEDEESNYKFLEMLLTKKGLNVLSVENGIGAVEICKGHNKIDLILMDIKMPGMNGLEATTKIKQMKPEIPIIIQTAYAMQNDEKISIEAGCDDYIAKPIKKEKLLSLLDKWLD
ncbi:response regulator [Bacteroidota bacterium]